MSPGKSSTGKPKHHQLTANNKARTVDDKWIEEVICDLLFAEDKNPAVTRLCQRVRELGPEGVLTAAKSSSFVDPMFRSFAYDRVFTGARAILESDKEWRFGPNRLHSFLHRFRHAHATRPVSGTTILELGCGPEHPVASSALFFANGAARTVALDIAPLRDPARSARALYDLLVECLAQPANWIFSDIDPAAFEQRVRTFDLARLKAGDLAGGIAPTPCEHRVADLREVHGDYAGTFDIMVSNAALEHVNPFSDFARLLFRLLRPGGVTINLVDFVDHRWYVGEAPHQWAYLTAGGGRDRFNINHLRCSQMDAAMREIGFETLGITPYTAPVPDAVKASLAPEFASLPWSDIETIRALLTHRRPAT